MLRKIFFFHLCIIFHFGLQRELKRSILALIYTGIVINSWVRPQTEVLVELLLSVKEYNLTICLEETTNTGISVKWLQSPPANKVRSDPLCYNHKKLITRDCVDSRWEPPAAELESCSQVVKYYNISTCPPGFYTISNNNNKYCYQIKHSAPWDYPCLKSGGASVITELSDDDVDSLLESLNNQNGSRYLWLPAKRSTFLGPVHWYIPGPKWGHQVISNNKLKIQTSFFKNCLLLDAKLRVIIAETCTESYPSLCFYMTTINYPERCPEKYHSVRYLNDESICLGIEFSPINLTYESFIDDNICEAPMGGQDSDELSRFIFKKIAEFSNLPDDLWCWFASSYIGRNDINYINDTNNTTDIHVSINNIGSLSLLNADLLHTLPCMACKIVTVFEKTELIFEYNEQHKVMYLTVYFPSGLWKYDRNDRGIQCFSDAKGYTKVIDVNDLPFIEVHSDLYTNTRTEDEIDKIVYEINIITDRAAQYWCEGHTNDFALIRTDKIVVNPLGDEVHVFSLVIKVHVSTDDIQNMLDTIRSNLCLNITNIFGANKVLLMEYLEYTSDCLMVSLHMDIAINNVYEDKASNIQKMFDKISQIAENELPMYNYILVNISSSMYCLPTTSIDNSLTLNWELTSIGHIAAPKQFCLQENGLPVKRLCAGSFLLGSYWGDIEGTCNQNYKPTDTTTFLYNFVKGQVPDNDITRFLTDGLNFVLGDVDIIIPADIYYLSMSLKHFITLAQQNQTSIDMGSFENIAWVMDRVTILDNRYLRLAQTLNSTNVILDSVNSIIEMLAQRSIQPTNTVLSRESNFFTDYKIAIQPQYLLQISYPLNNNITGLAVIRTSSNDNFTDMLAKPLFKNTTYEEILSISNLEIATWLPEEVFNSLKRNGNGSCHEVDTNDTDIRIIISVFYNDAIFQALDRNKYIVNSRIVGISIPGFLTNLEKPIPLIYKDLSPPIYEKFCGYWDFQKNSGGNVPGCWSHRGCYLKQYHKNLTFCECYHLTHFGQLLNYGRNKNITDSPDMKKHNKSLNIISLVGSFLSLLGIVGIWITASVFQTWRKKAGTKVLLHLSVSIALPLLFLIVFNLDDTLFEEHDGIYVIPQRLRIACISLGALLHYSVLASFMWMLITAVLQFIRYVRVLGVYRPPRFMIKFTLIGWGIPIIPVAVVLILDRENYVPNMLVTLEPKYSICYPSGFYMLVTVIVPISIILIVNVCLFILVICAISKGPDGKMRAVDVDLIGAQLRLTVFLFFLLGLTWVFGFFSFSNNLIWSYLFCLTSTMQGFVFFVYFIICDSQTRNLWVTLMKPQFSRSSSSIENISNLGSGLSYKSN